MQLLLARHLWGVAESWEVALPQFAAAGYRAIETPAPPPAERARFRSLLDANGLQYIAMIFTSGATVADHLAAFRSQVAAAAELNPILINAHSGRDAWNADDADRFFAEALTIEADMPIPVAHETHRGRATFTPWATARLLDRFDQLRLCCDLSHWVCVCERLIDDQEAIIRQCATRCIHLHARVGYEQGPQAPDPRAPEYRPHLEAHERWWGMIWDAQAARGMPVSTLTPEYGPPGYLHTLPYTNVPVADLRAICDWQAQRATAQFAARSVL
jgi:sugar phosphate isomerase/epimerase